MRGHKFERLIFWAFEFLKLAIIFLIFGLIVYYFAITIFVISGASMEPNFKDKEVVMVDKLSYLFKNPQRGDVVILKFPGRPSEKYIKRIIALPNETIEIKENSIYINNQKINEGYLDFGTKTLPDLKKSLGNNEYFVMGDNRENSNDSRIWGTCPKTNLVGRAFFTIWPLSSWNVVPKQTYW